MHSIDEYAQVFGIDVGRDAMTEIEHMAGTRAIACECVGNGLANHSG